jgi:hypothetical protein
MSRITITDHAVIRYLERVKGIDISAVRDEMRSAGLEAAITMGAETLKLGNGCRLRIVNETVVTVLPKRVTKVRIGKALA